MLDLTGGPRAFGREGFHLEEETNWRRTELADRVADRAEPEPHLPTRSDQQRLERRVQPRGDSAPGQSRAARAFVEGNDLTGELEIPLLTMHSTGDGQVPIEQARMLRRRVESAGRGDRLVEWVIPRPEPLRLHHPGAGGRLRGARRVGGTRREAEGHRRDGRRPPNAGSDVRARAAAGVVGRRRDGGGTGSRRRPRHAPPSTVRAFDARWIGAVVRKDGLVTPCNNSLPPVRNGRFEITVRAATEAAGCGGPGAEILLWTFANDTKMYSSDAVAWPGNGDDATLDASFSSTAPDGAATTRHRVQRRGDPARRPSAPSAARGSRPTCAAPAAASPRCSGTGNFAGYILSVVGPDSMPGCDRGAPITFRINGRRALGTAVNDPANSTSLDLTPPVVRHRPLAKISLAPDVT